MQKFMSGTMPLQRVALVGGSVLMGASLWMAQPVRADIQYSTEMRMPGQNGDKPFSRTITFRKQGAERVETSTTLGAANQKTIMLTLCEKLQMFTLDPNLKIYYATPLVKTEETSEAPAASANKDAAKTTGTITMTLVSLRALGKETVGDHAAQCYEVVTRMQSSGCAGDSDITTKQEICVAEAESLGDGACGNYSAAGAGQAGENPCQIAFVRKGDWTLYNQIMQKLQVRTRSFMEDGKPSMENQSKIVSRAKLSDELFTVPGDYRKVTAQEFQKAQSQAMMQMLMGGMGEAEGDDDAEAEE